MVFRVRNPCSIPARQFTPDVAPNCMICSVQDAIVIADALPTSCASNRQIGSENVPEAHVADNDDLYPWCCVHVVQLPSATCIDDWQVVQGVAITRGLPDSPANSHLHRALSLYQSRSVGVPAFQRIWMFHNI